MSLPAQLQGGWVSREVGLWQLAYRCDRGKGDDADHVHLALHSKWSSRFWGVGGNQADHLCSKSCRQIQSPQI